MHPLAVRALALASLVTLAAASQADAQRRPSAATLADAAGARAQTRDSADAVRDARRAQADYERQRFNTFGWTHDQGGGWCDERIGRFCLWYDDGRDEWKAPPEPAALTRARDALLARLDEAAARAPGDGWIAGQRVRYLVEAGRAADAASAARSCRAERWWCAALEGYALHAAGGHEASEAAFNAALAAMPEPERREWTDLRPVLAAEEERALRRAEGAERERLVRRLWWLADPFWMEPGNDRRTEHFARLVAARLQDRARTTEGLAWGDDLREILLRFGEPVGWERVRGHLGDTGRPAVVTHYAPRSWGFTPSARQLRDPARADSADWTLHDADSHTQYAPRYLGNLEDLSHQLAAFRRGGEAVVVAAWALKPDSLARSPRVDAALVAWPDADSAALAERARVSAAEGALRLRVPLSPAVFSVEAVERGSKRGGRARYGFDPRRADDGGLAISDVLLLKPGEARPETLEDAAALARPSVEVRAGERVGMFWEVYGLEGAADTVVFAVTLAREGVGAARRAAERLGLARSADPVRVRWREQPGGGAVLARSLAVALPRVPPGSYLLEVSVRAGARQATAVRRVRIAR